MEQMDLRVVNYNTNKLELVEFERKKSLTKERLETALLSFFNNDENQTNNCIDHIYESVGTIKGIRLKKTVSKKKNTPASKRKKIEPLTNYEPPSSDDDDNDDEDE